MTPKYAPDTLARMRQLWEHAPELSAAQIGERFGVTKNAVIGQAHRRGWHPRRAFVEPPTLPQRLDAINARMNRLLAETQPYVEDRKKLVIADPALVGLEEAA